MISSTQCWFLFRNLMGKVSYNVQLILDYSFLTKDSHTVII